MKNGTIMFAVFTIILLLGYGIGSIGTGLSRLLAFGAALGALWLLADWGTK